ncbi:MAG: HD domain-containing protein [Halanaerobiales bacterium]|nr:HD domain-containing protein [Halanaerobiales bacterium]
MILRDPIHGDISFTEREIQIIDTYEVQRLRGLRQLGAANLVYPGCVHTRFEHSLGTAYTAKKILQSLRWNGHPVDDEIEEIITIAAILHDITHLPYGHTLEDERQIFPRHDSGSRYKKLIDEGEAGQVLRKLGLKEKIMEMLTGDGNSKYFPYWAKEVISSTLDADVLDYLKRDAYFAGLAHDYDERVFSYFTIIDDRLGLNMVKHGLDRLDARSEILHLLRFRYFMMERVYTHHTKIIAGAMIAKAVEIAVEYGLREDDLLYANDYTLLEKLNQIGQEQGDKNIIDLVRRFGSRNLLKRAYVLSTGQLGPRDRQKLINTYSGSSGERRKIEEELAKELGVSLAEVVIYCPSEWVMKESAALVKTSLGVHRLNQPLLNPPIDVKVLEDQYEHLWRFYVCVPSEVLTQTGKLCDKIFKHDNEYRPCFT